MCKASPCTPSQILLSSIKDHFTFCNLPKEASWLYWKCNKSFTIANLSTMTEDNDSFRSDLKDRSWQLKALTLSSSHPHSPPTNKKKKSILEKQCLQKHFKHHPALDWTSILMPYYFTGAYHFTRSSQKTFFEQLLSVNMPSSSVLEKP